MTTLPTETQDSPHLAELVTRIPKAIKTIVHNRDGWTLLRLSDETGITYNRLCNHLNGKEGGLDLPELVGILVALDLTLAELEAVAQGNDRTGLLLSPQLQLVAANPTPEHSALRRPNLTLV